jgi:PPOX class probable FMN-dependent enzyme
VNLAELRALLGTPSRGAASKEIDFLDRHCRDFIARSPFFVLATASEAGPADASPKGGPAGFVRVLDDRRLAWGDLPGNRRGDSHQNLLERPWAALLFLIPGLEETLRVNGRVELTRDAEVLEQVALRGRPPALALVLEVEQAYLHCTKAFKRSRLWQPGTWRGRDGLASASEIFRDHTKL